MTANHTLIVQSSPSTAVMIGETILQPQLWCARQWLWIIGPFASKNFCANILEVAARIAVIAPLALLSAFAYSIGLIGHAIVACASKQTPRIPTPASTSSAAKFSDIELDRFLRQAIERGDENGVGYWLKNGADPKKTDAEGNTYVHLAVKLNRASIIPLLAQAGIDLNARDRQNCTPLIIACGDETKNDVVEALVKAGAATNVALLYLVIKKLNEKQLKALLSDPKLDVNQIEGLGWTPLYHALRDNFSKGAKLLVERGADVHCVVNHSGNTYNKTTALHQCQDPDLIEYLISKGAEPNRLDGSGSSPLLSHFIRYDLAAEKGNVEEAARAWKVITNMLAFGADCNGNGVFGRKDIMVPLLTWLVQAKRYETPTRKGYDELLKLWVSLEKIDLEKAIHNSCTAIMYAAFQTDLVAFKTLLQANACFNPHQFDRVRLMAMHLLPLKQIESVQVIDDIIIKLEVSDEHNPYLTIFKQNLCQIGEFPLTFKNNNNVVNGRSATLLEWLRAIKEGVPKVIAAQQAYRKSLLDTVSTACEGSGLIPELNNMIVEYLQLYHPQTYPIPPVEETPIDLNNLPAEE